MRATLAVNGLNHPNLNKLQYYPRKILFLLRHNYPAGNYMFKINNRNTRTRCEMCSKLTIKTPERRHWRHSGVFIVNFKRISHLVLVFMLLTLSRYTFIIPFLARITISSDKKEVLDYEPFTKQEQLSQPITISWADAKHRNFLLNGFETSFWSWELQLQEISMVLCLSHKISSIFSVCQKSWVLIWKIFFI